MIELKQVSFTYQGQEHDGLRDIDLTIADGECVLFCGRSGCGKTTITRLVNGLIPQFYAGELTGSVRVDGQEISGLTMYQIAAKVGSVFQNPQNAVFQTWTRTARSLSASRMRPGRPKNCGARGADDGGPAHPESPRPQYLRVVRRRKAEDRLCPPSMP